MKKLVFLLLALFAIAIIAHADDQADAKRKTLWLEFGKARPADVTWQSITVYAENPSLTQICFRANGTTYIFDLASKATKPVQHAKALPGGMINAITFHPSQDGASGAFMLWSNGEFELSIGARP